MLHCSSNSLRIFQLSWSLPGWIVAIVFSVAVLSHLQHASAAGCNYGGHATIQTFDSDQPGMFPQWTWWSAGQVQRLYESGEFTYFPVPSNSTPCNGPSCRGSTPKDSISVVTIIESQRTDWNSKSRSIFLPFSPETERVFGSVRLRYLTPILEGPFRPPCI